MRKFEGILICSDFDGTLAVPGPTISRENAAAIRHFQDNGGLFTFASGRSPEFFGRFSHLQANAPIIAANGTMICDPNTFEKLAVYPLPDEAMPVLDALAARPQTERMYLCDSFGQGIEWVKAEGKLPSVVFGAVTKPWFKVLLHQSEEDTVSLREYMQATYADAFAINRSYTCGIELHAYGSGKGACLRAIRARDARIRLTIGVGDYENDISLIQAADIGYAVENAHPAVKAAADRITVSCAEHAIANIIADLEASRRARLEA